jgi:hypothetical protein
MNIKDKIWIGVAILALCGMFAYPVIYKFSSKEVVITVTEKHRWSKGERSKYLIYTKDNIYENSRSILFWKFNSPELQKKLEIGKTYKVKVAGWRADQSKEFENIIKIIEIIN